MPTVSWTGSAVHLIDQTRLPDEEVWLDLTTVEQVAEAITSLRVRGAPAIGATAAFGLALAGDTLAAVEAAAALLVATRPTAVNLSWAVARVVNAARAATGSVHDAVVREALAIAAEDVAANRRLGGHGAALLPDRVAVLTHCNAGALATVDYGTALGVVRAAVEAGKQVHVWVPETRPVLQGARLTAWELGQSGIAATVVADTAVGTL